MNTILVTLAFVGLLLTAPASAEWIKFGEDDQDDHYFDSETIFIRDNTVRIWALLSTKKQVDPFGDSTRYLLEFNCTDLLYRQLIRQDHLITMGRGRITSEGRKQEWEYLSPDTIWMSLFRVACDR